MVLKKNTFLFNGKFYKQIHGTEMGAKMAPMYATLDIGSLEKLLYTKYEEINDSKKQKRCNRKKLKGFWMTVFFSGTKPKNWINSTVY